MKIVQNKAIAEHFFIFFMNTWTYISTCLKGLVHPKMKILSVFTHPHVVPNLHVFIFSAEDKGRYLEECFNQTDLIPHWLP